VKVREREKIQAEKQSIHLTYLPFIVKAVIAGLKTYPYLNSELNEEGQEIILKKYYNIGIAVDTPDGLIVPVIKGADEKSILDIAKEIEDFAEKAKKREIDLSDLKGGTFTITNIGVLGGTYFSPIPNYPEVAILGTGAIHDKAVVVDGKIVTRKVLPLSLAFDHRVLDGAMAQRFLNVVMQHLNDPDLILVELK
jgi:pyruvate dehydrogenase E2 component (dihydrolipoamide acetyltransferase)